MSLDIVYQDSDRLIVGIGPFDEGIDFGPGYSIATIDDQQESILSECQNNNKNSYLTPDDKVTCQ